MQADLQTSTPALASKAQTATCTRARNHPGPLPLSRFPQECPNIADPFHTLGLIYEGEGNPRRALDFFMIAAHLTPKDIPLWKRLAALSTQLGFFRCGGRSVGVWCIKPSSLLI